MHGQEQHTAEYLINFFHLGCIIALFTFQWGHVLSRSLSCSCSCLTTWWTKRFLPFCLSQRPSYGGVICHSTFCVCTWKPMMLPFTWNLFGRTLHATNFVSWDLKKGNFFKRIEGVIQFYSQRGKQIVLRKLGWGNFHAININFCEVSWHLSALNFSCKSCILQPAVLNISESLDFTNYHSLKRCSPKLILLVNTGIQIRVQI